MKIKRRKKTKLEMKKTKIQKKMLYKTKDKQIKESKKYRIPQKRKAERKQKNARVGCPICGDTKNLQVIGRCVSCGSCGWNKCNL